MGIFKGYDVRGVWGKEITEKEARRLGAAISKLGENIFIGMDVRLSSPKIL